MTASADARIVRWTAKNPCPLCGEHQGTQRNIGKRCDGFTSPDGWLRCRRVESDRQDADGLYVHPPDPNRRPTPVDAPVRIAAAAVPYPLGEPEPTIATQTLALPSLGKLTRVDAARDAAGRILALQARYDGDGGKTYRPWTWCGSAAGWRQGANGIGAPWFGVEGLAVDDRPVLIVEGPKTREPAAVIFPDWCVLSPFGGKGSIARDVPNLAGRTVAMWPDADRNGGGLAAFRAAIPAIREAGARSVRLVALPPELAALKDHWDLDDEPPAGLDLHALLAAADDDKGDDQQEKQGNRFKFLTPMDLANLPPMSWQVDGHLPRGGFIVLYGPSGGGKTFVGLDLALAVSTGLDWGGNDVDQGHVVYVSAEGSSGLNQRIKAWQTYRDNSRPLANIHFVTDAVNLLDVPQVLEFIAGIKSQHETPALVVLDTLARCLVGGDENSAQDMGKAIYAVDLIRKETGAAVMVIHHTTKANPETERGSSSLRGAADTMMLVRNDDGRITLTCEKQKDGAPFTATDWKLHPIDAVESCVPVKVERNETVDGQRGEASLTAVQRTVLTAIREAGRDGVNLKQLVQATGRPRSTVHHACGRLLDGRWILYNKPEGLYTVGSSNPSNAVQSRPIGQAETALSNVQPVQQPLGVGRVGQLDGQPGTGIDDDEVWL